MNFNDIKSLNISTIGNVMKITVNDVVIWKSDYTNMVSQSINADGSIYNNGLGYKTGYRVRSSGVEIEDLNTYTITGYISVQPGDVIRIYDMNLWHPDGTAAAINVSDINFNNLGQTASNGYYGVFADNSEWKPYRWANSVVDEGNGVYRWIVPPFQEIAYIRITLKGKNDPMADKMVITINEIIE